MQILDSALEATRDAAAARLMAGELVALPTETVYGLAGDATNGQAVARIYEAKGRPAFNPLIAHVSSFEMARQLVDMNPVAEKLAAQFWPGPLTLVLPVAEGCPVHPLATAGLPTLAVRMPAGPMRDIVRRVGRPLAAPSANRSGGVSPTTAAHVAHSLGEKVGMIVDGGSARVGLESTIVKSGETGIYLLRPGGLPREAIEDFLGMELLGGGEGGIEAPGQMTSHYAPSGHVRLNAVAVKPGEYLIGFGSQALPGQEHAAGFANLSPTGDLVEAAANLFAVLAAFDAPGIHTIAVAPVPEHGLGLAINDRLRRAAAPRPFQPEKL
ncbi:threonylcarbamoyl-AMP synthase [Aureimonas fodinaquatilis]|uniref:Threonylcarbamoyl-AMP synthase n=1 Tax=Aureimonas fodinaquatilis TaxID=2565783 RepID=A0A5B0E070_9HYPH|nr:L-threonylcarbamoyladenylate synthase [Aureimonas fodinaquatilis]KAA0972457.1 threonylcarbamoyl-AMP synthase [Aureimonas fodinaquatilis]